MRIQRKRKTGVVQPIVKSMINAMFAKLRAISPANYPLGRQSVFLIVILVGGSRLAFGQGVLRPVTTLAASNLQAPGFAADVHFQKFVTFTVDEAFNAPLLNSAGQTAFFSTIAGPGISTANDTVMWSSGTGTFHAVAQEGEQAPGAPSGVVFQSFGFPVLSDTGEIAFPATLGGLGVSSANNQGIWLEKNGQLQLVARMGNQAIGAPAGVNFGSFSDLRIASGGRVAFISTQLTGAGITTNNDAGIWSDRGSGLQLAARKGNSAPGLTSGVVFGNFGFQGIAFGGNANLAFDAHLSGPGVTADNDFGIWSQSPAGKMNLVAREGNQATGMPAGYVWHDINSSDPFNTPGTNSNGDVVFLGRLTGGPAQITGAWSSAGGLHLVSVEGAPISGLPGITASNFPSTTGDLHALINHRGDVAYREDISSGTGGTQAVLAFRNSTAQVVAREGNPTPGLPGQTFKNFDDLVALNGNGQVAFRANGNLWVQDRTGALQLVVAPGDQLQVSPGDIRTVQNALLLTGAGNDDGLPTSFTDDGKLAFNAFFTDGSDGMFLTDIASVCEPSTFAMSASGFGLAWLVMSLLRRRQSRGVCSRAHFC